MAQAGRTAVRVLGIVAGVVVVGLLFDSLDEEAGPTSKGDLVVSDKRPSTVLPGETPARPSNGPREHRSDRARLLVQRNGFLAGTSKFYDRAAASFKEQAERSAAMPAEDEIAIMHISDLHCNLGMTHVLRAIANTYRPAVVVSSGDDTMSGTYLEKACVHGLARIHQQTVSAQGNHDSTVTERQAEAVGITALDGHTVSISWLTLLGDDDPRRSGTWQGTTQERRETVSEMGDRLAEIACGDRPDVLVVHDGRAAQETIARGCTGLALYGHLHYESGPRVSAKNDGSYTVEYMSASSGGAAQGPVGRLEADASAAIFYLDSATHLVTGYQQVTLHPDTSVTIDARLDIPPQP